MATYALALIGFGGVNRALVEVIQKRGDELSAELGLKLSVVAITDLRLGLLVQDEGIDLARILALSPTDTFAGLEGGHAEPRNEHVIRNTNATLSSKLLIQILWMASQRSPREVGARDG